MPQARPSAPIPAREMTPREAAKALHASRKASDVLKSSERIERDQRIGVDLSAVIIAVTNDEPIVRLVSAATGEARLPSADFDPREHGSLDEALRSSVLDETGLDLGHVEQLQAALCQPNGTARLSIGFLALAHATDDMSRTSSTDTSWRSWYTHFPWEDWRRGKPLILSNVVEPKLMAWIDQGNANAKHRHDCVRMLFGIDGGSWDEEKVLERFDLLAEAGLLADLRPQDTFNSGTKGHSAAPLRLDHHRFLAMAMSRLRARIKYRPVIFDLMPPLFTLFELQRTVEAILGPHLHKQNFRRLVEHMGLVEPTDEVKTHTGGRPAKLFRFRSSVMLERCQPGVRVRAARN